MKRIIILAFAILLATLNLSAGVPFDTVWKKVIPNVRKAHFVHNDSKILMSIKGINKLVEFDAETGDSLRVIEGPNTSHLYGFSKNPTKIFTAYGQPTYIQSWEYNTGILLNTMNINVGNIPKFDVSEDEKLILTGVGGAILIRSDSLIIIGSNFPGYGMGDLSTIKISNDNSMVATGTVSYFGASPTYFKVNGGVNYQEVILHDDMGDKYNNCDAIYNIDFSENNEYVCYSNDCTLSVFSLKTKNKLATLINDNPIIREYYSGQFFKNNKYLFAFGDRELDIYETKNYSRVKRFLNIITQFGINEDDLQSAVSSDDKYILAHLQDTIFMIRNDLNLVSIENEIENTDLDNIIYDNGISFYSNQISTSPPKLYIYDLLGNSIINNVDMISDGNRFYHNCDLPKGFYFARIVFDDKTINSKIMIDR